MVKGDIFTSPIDFALQETMKRFENADNNDDKLLYEAMRRSRAMWENIRINGLKICGMTYEQFCEQLENKKNIVFLSDDEVENFNKAVQIMNVLSK
jgi:hypothetical protein